VAQVKWTMSGRASSFRYNYSDTEQLKVVFAAVEESILKAAIEDLVRNRESLRVARAAVEARGGACLPC
jgi:hypothetical protein